MRQIKEVLVKQFSHQEKAEQTEKCILCGGETGILVSEPIHHDSRYLG